MLSKHFNNQYYGIFMLRKMTCIGIVHILYMCTILFSLKEAEVRAQCCYGTPVLEERQLSGAEIEIVDLYFFTAES